MKKKHTFYCWMGAFPRGKCPSEKPISVATPHRPPSKKSAAKAPYFDETWWVHETLFDQPATKLQALCPGEAFASKTDAEDWITKGFGATWASQADVYSLWTFEVEVDCK
jgi:hypothetical protein